jgi:recombination protein RecT
MATPADITKAMAVPKAVTVQDMIQKSIKELGKALPEGMRPERLARIALTCIRVNPKLAECTPESFLGALFTAAQLGLEPIAGLAYLIPFDNNRRKPDGSWHTVKEVQLVVGYKGLNNLFFRHEKSIQLDWGVVHEKDDFDYRYGTDAFLNHVPAKGDRGPVTTYYVVATLAGGGKPFQVMSAEECMAHGRKHSKTYVTKEYNKAAHRNEPCEPHFKPESPWATNPESMCLKTVAIQLFKLLPLSMELQRAITVDETSREYRRGIEDALDLPDTNEWNETEVNVTPEQPTASTPVQPVSPAPVLPTKDEELPF